jgi:hypothetical protein
MHVNHLLFSRVPAGHPGDSRPLAPGGNAETDPIRRAAAEAELLRARLRQGESHAGNLGTVLWEAA